MTINTNRAELEARQMRSDVFAALRRHDASDDLFAEIAAITHHYIAALPKPNVRIAASTLEAEPDWEAWRPALERFYSHWDDCSVATPMDDEDKANVRGLIAFLAPLAQRGMTEQEIEALAREIAFKRGITGASNLVSIRADEWRADLEAAIRATRSRAPVAGWPGDKAIKDAWNGTVLELLRGQFSVGTRSVIRGVDFDAMRDDLARRLRAHMTGGDFFAESAKKSARITVGEQQAVAAAMTDEGLA